LHAHPRQPGLQMEWHKVSLCNVFSLRNWYEVWKAWWV